MFDLDYNINRPGIVHPQLNITQLNNTVMQNFFFLIIVILAVISYSSADDDLPIAIPVPLCPLWSNSHWVQCVGCEPKCTQEPPGWCLLICKPGCRCNTGYIRDLNGKCITMKQCENTCNCPEGEDCVCSPKVCVKAPCFQFDCV